MAAARSVVARAGASCASVGGEAAPPATAAVAATTSGRVAPAAVTAVTTVTAGTAVKAAPPAAAAAAHLQAWHVCVLAQHLGGGATGPGAGCMLRRCTRQRGGQQANLTRGLSHHLQAVSTLPARPVLR